MTRAIVLLEGGAFRTLYTAGVLDVFMERGLWLDTLGVSGGALTGANYVSRQPERTRIINLAHRHDANYVGAGALRREHSIIGFKYLFGNLCDRYPFEEATFYSGEQRYIAVATCCETGQPVYFDRDALPKGEIYQAMAASSSMPVVCPPVKIGNFTYLDGGLSDSLGLHWAMREGYERIIVIRTRDRHYRKPAESKKTLALYTNRYPAKPLLREDLMTVSVRYNAMADELEQLEAEGKIFTIAPSHPVTVTRLENDLKKLQTLYLEGRQETDAVWDDLMAYLQ